ncbi:MAG: ribosome silencing factor [Pseudomonadota bacterium]
MRDFISSSLEDDKAQNIVSIDLKGKTTIADFLLIATGTSSRHVAGMAQKLCEKLSADRKIKTRLEGLEVGDWVIVDAGDVVVHLFREEVRQFYNLEKLWGADFSTVEYMRYQ